jgi:ubiquinone/menaquinone biosynthesis C-methylase UbiE
VGSGGQGIFGFLSPLRRDCDFFLLDVRKDALKGLRRAHPVIGDGCRLPFTDKAFDIIVSIDTTEHIPKFIRHSFYEELKRAHKKKIIITCPMQSNDGLFQGKKYDIVFQYFYKKEKGIEEPNTAQHIASDHPTVNEIKEEFPGVQSMDIKTVIFGLNICCFHLNRS